MAANLVLPYLEDLEEGSFEFEFDGSIWREITCHQHRDHKNEQGEIINPDAGFDPECEGCLQTAELLMDHIHRVTINIYIAQKQEMRQAKKNGR